MCADRRATPKDTQMLGLQFRGKFLEYRERVVCTRQRHDRHVIGAS
jgi:hypothetical protein